MLCTMYFPVCISEKDYLFIKPCKHLCESVMKSCKSHYRVLQENRFAVIKPLDCSLLQSEPTIDQEFNEAKVCMNENDFLEIASSKPSMNKYTNAL